MTIPSALDRTIAPPGKHVVNLFVQYAPYGNLRAAGYVPRVLKLY